MASYQIKELWKEYEQVAMHFNDLLMRLRTQSLGGLAAVGTVASFLIKDNLVGPERLIYLAVLSGELLVAWAALAVLDLTYYDRMLIGAVHAIHALEKTSKETDVITEIDLSHRITDAVDKKLPSITRSPWYSGRKAYYVLVGAILFFLTIVFSVSALL